MLPLVLFFAFISCVVSTPAVESLDDIRIVGGQNVDIKEVPYQISLVSKGRHLCGGAIVANDIIITAAHCVSGTKADQYQVHVGSSYTNRDGKLYPVSDLMWHPNFNYHTMDSDVAILWLSKPLEFNERVTPIELVKEGEELTNGDLTTVTGWGNLMESGGTPTQLQIVTIPKVSDKKCNEAYNPVYTITSRMFCAGVPEGGKDACQGDSGGPLVYNKKLAGVVSWGLGCARPDYPGVYTKLSALRKWIDTNIVKIRRKHLWKPIV